MARPKQIGRRIPSTLKRDAIEFHDALVELIRVYQFRDRDQICCHDVSVTQCYAVEALVRRGPLSLNRLALELYLDKSTASRVVAALVRKGYVGRSPDPKDSRAVALRATPSGERLYARVRDEMVRQQVLLLADIPSEARRAAAGLLRRLARTTADRMTGRTTAGGPACGCPIDGENA